MNQEDWEKYFNGDLAFKELVSMDAPLYIPAGGMCQDLYYMPEFDGNRALTFPIEIRREQ